MVYNWLAILFLGWLAEQELLKSQNHCNIIMDLEDEETKKNVEEVIRGEIAVVKKNPLVIKQNGCAACYILFSIVNKIQLSEQDAADLLSEVVFTFSHSRCLYVSPH